MGTGNATFTAPRGWTNNNDGMDIQYYWAESNCDGQRMAKSYGLSSPDPIMCNNSESGNCLYLFQSGSKYYVWNEAADTVNEITSPTNLTDIVNTIASGFKNLQLKKLEPTQ